MTTHCADGPLRVGVDIGGTKTDAVVLDRHGKIIERYAIATDVGSDGVLGTAMGAVHALAAATGHRATEFSSIGVGIPGRVDSETGMVTHAVISGSRTSRSGRCSRTISAFRSGWRTTSTRRQWVPSTCSGWTPADQWPT